MIFFSRNAVSLLLHKKRRKKTLYFARSGRLGNRMWVAVVGRKLEIFTVPLLVPSILGLDKELSWEKGMGPSVEWGSLVLHTHAWKKWRKHM